MTVYHGSICEIKVPDVTLAKARLDFGRAFYLTSFKRQAERWARRKAARTRGTPIVTVYRLADELMDFRVKDFCEADGDWLDFVCACRAGRAVWRSFDIIRGRVANDDVFKTIDAYLKGDMTRNEALNELRYAGPNDQIAITTPLAIKALLTFRRSYVVRDAGR